jgi:sirohydrochlorin cobaltochelatase
MSKGIILFGHGARNPDWAQPFHRIRAAILEKQPDVPVELAFLELMAPTLDQAIDTLAARGVRTISIVPIFMAAGGHIKKDLPAQAAAALDRHPGLEVSIAAPVGEADYVIDAMANYALG